jgi:hypothetical protein
MQGIEYDTEYPTCEQRRSSDQPQSTGWVSGARWILLLAVTGWCAFLAILAFVL